MHSWRRIKCWVWHRGMFDKHRFTIDGPTYLGKRIECEGYACNRRDQLWVVPVYATGPQRRVRHAR
jgi:hypothetical protein